LQHSNGIVVLLVQVISPHEVMGCVEIVEHLSTVQDKVYMEPTVLVVDNVTGWFDLRM
jgi:hypothetical protein